MSRSNPIARRRLAPRLVLLAGALALAGSARPAIAMTQPGLSAGAGPSEPAPPAEGTPSALRVQVEPTIDDASLLPGWIVDRHPGIAEEIPSVEGHEQWIAVEISGATYDYHVSVVAMRDGAPLGTVGEPAACECTNEKLLELVDTRIAEVVEAFDAQTPTEVQEPEPQVAPAPVTPTDPGKDSGRRRSPFGPLGYTGIGVAVLGVGLLGAGIPLAVRPDEPEVRGDPPELYRSSTHPPGIALAVSGGAALAAAATLLVVDVVRRRRSSVAVLPVFGPRRAGLSIICRF